MLFKKRAETSTQAPPGPTHIHNHTPGAAGEVWARVLAAVVLIVLAWFALVFLADQAGVYRPAEFVAQGLFWLGGLAAIAWLLNHMLGDHLDRWYAHRETIEEQRTNQLRYRQLMINSAVVDSRRLGDDKRLAALIYQVMMDAYNQLPRNGKFRKTERPWSRRMAGAQKLISLGEDSPVGETFGARVRPALLRAGIVDGETDQINLKHFPDIGSVQRVLYQPVLANPGQTGLERSNWTIIE